MAQNSVWNVVPRFGVTLFYFMEQEEDPLFMGNGRFPPKKEGEGGAFLVHYDLFFL